MPEIRNFVSFYFTLYWVIEVPIKMKLNLVQVSLMLHFVENE